MLGGGGYRGAVGRMAALCGQIFQPPPALLHPVPGGRELVIQIEGPGQGGGAAKLILHLRGEGVDKLNDVRPTVFPSGLSVVEGAPDGFGLLGRLLGVLAAGGIVPDQGGELLLGLGLIAVIDRPEGVAALLAPDQGVDPKQGQSHC